MAGRAGSYLGAVARMENEFRQRSSLPLGDLGLGRFHDRARGTHLYSVASPIGEQRGRHLAAQCIRQNYACAVRSPGLALEGPARSGFHRSL